MEIMDHIKNHDRYHTSYSRTFTLGNLLTAIDFFPNHAQNLIDQSNILRDRSEKRAIETGDNPKKNSTKVIKVYLNESTGTIFRQKVYTCILYTSWEDINKKEKGETISGIDIKLNKSEFNNLKKKLTDRDLKNNVTEK